MSTFERIQCMFMIFVMRAIVSFARLHLDAKDTAILVGHAENIHIQIRDYREESAMNDLRKN